jgi:hypothetical protein
LLEKCSASVVVFAQIIIGYIFVSIVSDGFWVSIAERCGNRDFSRLKQEEQKKL